MYCLLWCFILFQKMHKIPFCTEIKEFCAFFIAMFKYNGCVIMVMTDKTKKWPTVKAFFKDLEKKKQDPLFIKAWKEFMKYHTS